MSESYPAEGRENQPRKYSFTWEGREIVMSYLNSIIYLHPHTPMYDHIYVHLEDDGNNEERGFYLWRRVQSNFDLMVYDLTNDNCSRIVQESVSEIDMRNYMARFGGDVGDATGEMVEDVSQDEKPVETAVNSSYEAPELDWISPRQERVIKNAVGFLIYLAENGRLE